MSRRRFSLSVTRRRLRRRVARAIYEVGGDRALQTARGQRRPAATDVLGTLADPAQVYDPVTGGEAVPSGFVQQRQRDGVLPVYDPAFVDAAGVGWGEDDLVIGVSIGGASRAYPVRYLDKREMILDELGGEPIVVSWCSVCATAMVHSRRLGDETLVFGHQGALWENAMTWWDHDTGSIWSQPFGACIAGPRKGGRVRLLASTLTSWRAWREANLHTEALDAPSRPGALDADDLALVYVAGDEALGFPVASVREYGVANGSVAGMPVVAVVAPDAPGAGAVFSRNVDGDEVTFSWSHGEMCDGETGTVWDPASGEALAGPLRGASLVRLPSTTAKPGEFAKLWPEAEVWEPGG